MQEHRTLNLIDATFKFKANQQKKKESIPV